MMFLNALSHSSSYLTLSCLAGSYCHVVFIFISRNQISDFFAKAMVAQHIDNKNLGTGPLSFLFLVIVILLLSTSVSMWLNAYLVLLL